jgi:Fe-S-cluster containining protein
MIFPCSQCGACCRRVGKFKDFPEPVRRDGSCSHLQEDNSCAIYETRPLVCRITEGHRVFFPELSEKDYLEGNIKACNEMIIQDGLDAKYLIS